MALDKAIDLYYQKQMQVQITAADYSYLMNTTVYKKDKADAQGTRKLRKKAEELKNKVFNIEKRKATQKEKEAFYRSLSLTKPNT